MIAFFELDLNEIDRGPRTGAPDGLIRRGRLSALNPPDSAGDTVFVFD
jgi:hypothetical protein